MIVDGVASRSLIKSCHISPCPPDDVLGTEAACWSVSLHVPSVGAVRTQCFRLEMLLVLLPVCPSDMARWQRGGSRGGSSWGSWEGGWGGGDGSGGIDRWAQLTPRPAVDSVAPPPGLTPSSAGDSVAPPPPSGLGRNDTTYADCYRHGFHDGVCSGAQRGAWQGAILWPVVWMGGWRGE